MMIISVKWSSIYVLNNHQPKKDQIMKIVKTSEEVSAWLRARPEVGTLNSGKYYVHIRKDGQPPIYKEIPVFNMDTGKPSTNHKDQ